MDRIVISRYLLLAVPEIFQFARCGVDLKRFKKTLCFVKNRNRICNACHRHAIKTPKREPGINRLTCHNKAIDCFFNRLLKSLYRFIFALSDQLSHAWSHSEQFKECLQCLNIPLSWLLKVLEADKLIHTCCRKRLKLGSIELFTGNGEYCVSGIDQCSNNHNSPFWFKTGCSRIHILNAVVILKKLTVVENLTMAFALEKLKNKPGMTRLVRINLFSIKQPQCVEDSGCLFGAILPCNGPQSVLCGL